MYRPFASRAWYAVLGPAGLPAPLVERLHKDFVQVMNQPELRKKLAELGLSVRTSSPAELRALMSADVARWKSVVAAAHIEAE
jgi:tripartite-type tricarboxylate transporter receptor subunit TctC